MRSKTVAWGRQPGVAHGHSAQVEKCPARRQTYPCPSFEVLCPRADVPLPPGRAVWKWGRATLALGPGVLQLFAPQPAQGPAGAQLSLGHIGLGQTGRLASAAKASLGPANPLLGGCKRRSSGAGLGCLGPARIWGERRAAPRGRDLFSGAGALLASAHACWREEAPILWRTRLFPGAGARSAEVLARP